MFERVAGDVIALLRGRTVVAHNLAFDGPFLASEYAGLGVTVPLGAETGLCTMRLAGWFLPAAGRSLASCCAEAGVDLRNAHCALDDARAAAELLGYYLSMTGRPPPWARLAGGAPARPWPDLPRHGVEPIDRSRAGQLDAHFLSRLVDRLPRTHRPTADAYLDLLDRALLDGYISMPEADALVAVASELRLGAAEMRALHESYLRDLVHAAAGSESLSQSEYQNLLLVSALLALTPGHVEDALGQARLARRGGAVAPRFRLAAGDVVVFTGEAGEPRREWEARARSAGLVVGDAVTRTTRLLVAADSDSMSGKADRAHRYGIPVVHPSAFARLLEGVAAA